MYSVWMPAGQVRKGSVGDALLAAAAHVERVDAGQVHKGSVRDARLSAVAHFERVDAGQVHKGCLRRPSSQGSPRTGPQPS